MFVSKAVNATENVYFVTQFANPFVSYNWDLTTARMLLAVLFWQRTVLIKNSLKKGEVTQRTLLQYMQEVSFSFHKALKTGERMVTVS